MDRAGYSLLPGLYSCERRLRLSDGLKAVCGRHENVGRIAADAPYLHIWLPFFIGASSVRDNLMKQMISGIGSVPLHGDGIVLRVTCDRVLSKEFGEELYLLIRSEAHCIYIPNFVFRCSSWCSCYANDFVDDFRLGELLLQSNCSELKVHRTCPCGYRVADNTFQAWLRIGNIACFSIASGFSCRLLKIPICQNLCLILLCFTFYS